MQEAWPAGDGYFTTQLAADDHLWTAGFFNERFPEVVSPLGWSVVRRLIEPTAFLEPLTFVGYRLPEDFPFIKLYCGHVYTNVAVFQRLYRVFPEALMPRDAGRYFPGGDTSLRRKVPLPAPARLIASMAETLVTEPGWHPLNFLTWNRFVSRFDRQVASSLQRIEAADDKPARLLEEAECMMDASLSLLRLHRWSITYADVLYDLLRKLLAAWVDAEKAGELAAALTSGLPNKSTETDVALWRLTETAAELNDAVLEHLRTERFDAFLNSLDATSGGRRFQHLFRNFLTRYGHRSPSLDVRYPAYADERSQVLALVVRMLDDGRAGPATREATQQERRHSAVNQVRQSLRKSPARWSIFKTVLWFTQRYVILREDQRFYWQKSMHAKRRAFLRIGRALAAGDLLAEQDDVFFLTLSEVAGIVRGWLKVPEVEALVTERRADFEALQGASYPAFLRGNLPLEEIAAQRSHAWRRLSGLPASPGCARGPALVVRGPAAFDAAWQRLSARSILVTSSTDPAWTPLFLRVSGLVMERGGQLSHGAVVAREYGLPAVVGVAGALDHIADGQLIEVDGGAGTVTVLT